MIIMWFDGAYDGYTGDMGLGVHIENDAKPIYQQSLKVFKNKDHPNTSNNVAEYLALIDGLNYLLQHFPKAKISVRGDSMLVIKQMKNEWRAKEGVYKPYHKIAAALVWKFTDISFTWIPREQNSKTDDLSNILWNL